jgi:GGDEF domain-containing protein
MDGPYTADTSGVERPHQSLLPLIDRRFQSFADATDAALDMLAGQVPGEIIFGQIEPGEDHLRVLDVRGASVVGIERGTLIPLAAAARSRSGLGPRGPALEGTGAGLDELDAAHMRSLGLGEWIALPLEMSDGAIVGMVAALSRRQADYRAEDVIMLALTARVLAYEWERVRTRTQLRELRERIGATTDADADTGLVDRDAFLDRLEREWKLARRGAIDIVLACFRIEAAGEGPDSPVATQALKDAAEALSGAIRSTDLIGRTGRMDLGVAIVGCRDVAEADVLAERFGEAVRRMTQGRPSEVRVSHGAVVLAEAPSAHAAIELARAAVEDGEQVSAHNGEPA